jgi:AcrR family transcriptional regulator
VCSHGTKRCARALVNELCVHDFRAFGAHFAQAANVKDPIERLRRAGAVYFDFARQHPQHYRLMFMTPLPPHPTIQTVDPAEDAYGILLATVEQALAEGRLRPTYKDAALVAQTIWAAAHGVVSLEIAKGCEKGWIAWRPLDKRMVAMMDAIVAAFVEPGSGKRGSSSGASSNKKRHADQFEIETGVPTLTFSKNFCAMKPGMRMQPCEAG